MVSPLASRECPYDVFVMVLELGVILLLVLINGVLAGAEIAVVSVERMRLSQLVESGNRRARAVEELRKNPERFFAAVQIGITIIGATAGAFGGSRFARHLEPLIAGIAPLRTIAPQVSFVVVIGILSFLSVVLGELVPKSLALRYANNYAVTVGPVILWLSSAARPLMWLFTSSSNAVLSLFGVRTTFAAGRMSSEELQHLVSEATESGSIHPAAGEIASRALGFADLTAAEVMVPRSRIVGIPHSAQPEDIQRIVTEYGYSRLPVYGETIDEIHGYILVKDLLSMAWERQLIVLDDLVRPPYLVIEGTKATALLQEMRRRRVHLAVVTDEHGGTSGIVTMEDLLEELVGEIFSEIAGDIAESIRRLPDGSALVQGDTPIRELNRELGIELPEGEDWSTVAGLCLALAGRIPAQGEVLRSPDGTPLEIETATERRVVRVRIYPRVEDAAPSAPS
jgi:putative hemolysin